MLQLNAFTVPVSQPFIVSGALNFHFPAGIKISRGPMPSTWHSELHIVGIQKKYGMDGKEMPKENTE